MSGKQRRVPSQYYPSSDDDDLDISDKVVNDHMKFTMMNQFNRFNNEDTPEKKAIKKAKKELVADEKNCQQFYQKSFVLEIHIKNIQPRIYRKIRVPGGIDLRVLHDRVIAPAFGWCRAYHSYYFRQIGLPQQFSPVGYPQVGVVYGDQSSGSVDMSHSMTHGIWIVDDTNLKLAQILNQVGKKLEYMYDFGDSWAHKITLLEIDDDYHGGIVELMEGARTCPPEDHGSIMSYAESLEILKDRKNSKWYETNAKCLHAANYQMHHEKGKQIFNPDEFDLNLTRKRLALALQSKTSKNFGQNMTMTPISAFLGGGHHEHDMEPQLPTFKETTDIDPENVKRECAICKKPTSTRCSRCRVVFYCGVEHQKQHWPSHKANCLQPNK